MKLPALVLIVLIAGWSLALVPAAGAIRDVPQCIRQGPPCGPEPVDIPCLVDNHRDCLVSVETYVCVTDPCPGIIICVLHGRHCVVP